MSLQDVIEAHDALEALVMRAASGVLSDGEAREEMAAWSRGAARGSGTLARAAILVMEYELAAQGSGGTGEQATLMRALRGLERALVSPYAEADMPVEVETPPEFKLRFPNARGYRMGELSIIAEREETGWHLSVSHPSRYPDHGELQKAATVAAEPGGSPAAAPNLWALVRPGAEAGAGGFVIHLYEFPGA